VAFVISHKYKFVYVHIPKTGGTSLCESEAYNRKRGGYLANILPSSDIAVPHQHPYFVAGLGFFKWATIRDPYDRFVSIYHDAVRRFGDRTFSEFVDEVADRDVLDQDMIRWPQKGWVIDRAGRCLVDRFVDFKRMVEGSMEVLSSLGVPLIGEFPHKNKSDRRQWESYYTDGEREVVGRIYADDIEMYGEAFHRDM